MKKLTKTHREYMKRYVTSLFTHTMHINSPTMNLTLSQHGFNEKTAAMRITAAGLEWLGCYSPVEIALIMALQATRLGNVVSLKQNDSEWVAIAMRYYAEAARWEMRAEVEKARL